VEKRGERLEEIEARVRSYLGLNHRLVGIKISKENLEGHVSASFDRHGEFRGKRKRELDDHKRPEVL